jgi:hypothetical protein
VAKSSKNARVSYKDVANLLAWIVELDDRIEALENKSLEKTSTLVTWNTHPHLNPLPWTCTCAPEVNYKTGELICTCPENRPKKKGAKK